MDTSKRENILELIMGQEEYVHYKKEKCTILKRCCYKSKIAKALFI